jgi:hypothetical protein
MGGFISEWLRVGLPLGLAISLVLFGAVKGVKK